MGGEEKTRAPFDHEQQMPGARTSPLPPHFQLIGRDELVFAIVDGCLASD